MIELIFIVILAGLACAAISAFPIAQPFKTIAYLLCCLLLLVWIAHFFGVWDGGDVFVRHHWRGRR